MVLYLDYVSTISLWFHRLKCFYSRSKVGLRFLCRSKVPKSIYLSTVGLCFHCWRLFLQSIYCFTVDLKSVMDLFLQLIWVLVLLSIYSSTIHLWIHCWSMLEDCSTVALCLYCLLVFLQLVHGSDSTVGVWFQFYCQLIVPQSLYGSTMGLCFHRRRMVLFDLWFWFYWQSTVLLFVNSSAVGLWICFNS